MTRIPAKKHRKHKHVEDRDGVKPAKIRVERVRDWPERMTAAVGSPASLLVHTVLFAGAFTLPFFGVDFDRVLLVLTTIVSLEAIYLALFIQMTVNRNTASLAVVEEEIDEIQEDVAEITEDIEDISDDIEEINEDVAEITEDVAEITEDVAEITEDIEDISDDIEELNDEGSTKK